MRSTVNVADSIGCGTSVRLAEYALNVLALRGNATQTSLLVFYLIRTIFYILGESGDGKVETSPHNFPEEIFLISLCDHIRSIVNNTN